MALHKKPAAKHKPGPSKSGKFMGVLKSWGYQFRLNECDDAIELVSGDPYSDKLEAKLWTQLGDHDYDISAERLRAYIASYAYDNSYHPVHDYLNGLRWDGKKHISRLAEYVDDVDNVFGLWLRKWLIGAVAKAKLAAQNPMLIIDGPQGKGKSELAKWLCPIPRMYIEGPLDPEAKDDNVRLINKWIWEVSEFSHTANRADIDALKQFLTKSEVTIRRPYGRNDITKPALCSFIGTVNNVRGLFSDPTGTRRFLTATIRDIDWDYPKKINRDQVWAEAHAAFLDGEKHTLTPDEAAQRDELNQRYEMDDALEGYLRTKFFVDRINKNWWTPTNELLAELDSSGYRTSNTRAASMSLADTMRRLGLERVRQRNGNNPTWGYLGIKRIAP